MTEPKDGESFFRKVARFVANPTTDWAEINSRHDDPEADAAKAELRAMVERKRRNDFVRKREFDMLRRIRREGLTPEQLAALSNASSRIDSSVGRASETHARQGEAGVKAKIDQIEQQMVGEGFAPTQVQANTTAAPPPGFFETSTRPVNFATTMAATDAIAARVTDFAPPSEVERLETRPAPASAVVSAALPPLSAAPASRIPDLSPLPFAPSAPIPALSGLDMALGSEDVVEVNEVVHDAELDEAVIAFANGDYQHCERCLVELTGAGGRRHGHPETWLVLFDLYRATGQQAQFEQLATDYAQQFGLSSPQWFSLPKWVAEAARQERRPSGPAQAGGVSWTCPEILDRDAVAQIRGRCETLPLPWVLDWQALQQIEPEACEPLRQLFRDWAGRPLDLRWLAGDHFLQLLAAQAPLNLREVSPAYWMLRLEALHLANRPDQFDEVAIDYCVTYEVSPPSWEKPVCRLRISGNGLSAGTASGATIGPMTEAGGSTFMESTITELLSSAVQLELSGQLSGDIGETLKLMNGELGAATLISISCAKLIRLDFVAAGDLLNWVLSRRSENRAVQFTDAHRLVALFFGAMGINEHAKIKVRMN
ncbi:STAS domain-containing protein [Pelomonas sp. CA6]|uniref:STAS domain-containing protein n=1 Tax=Pelomonas sp. CA6 TaxID=2907999 RepID=UPI001F4C4C83|nr:STAS domain-containing protein [Pelomonas sp. CA6]MCH7344686.1 STAS domain-containing protein [Pelomonas sp. CA6]